MSDKSIYFCAQCITPSNGMENCMNCSSKINEQNQLVLTEEAYLNAKRVRCKRCAGPIIDFAKVCFLCQEEQ
jgi:hypothetical protein